MSITHGTKSGYSKHRCRCVECRAAWATYMRELSARKRAAFDPADPTLIHGRPTTYARGCRCGECRAERSAAIRGRYARNAELSGLAERRLGACQICGTVTGRLVVDHDHATGEYRGMLCNGCNTGLGKLGDSIAGLERALAYLRGSILP